MPKVGVILNLSARKASKINTNDIIAVIGRELPDAKIYIVKKSFERTVQQAVKDGCKLLCAAGGDGTMSGVASACIEHNLVLGVLPLGTMNNFSKDLNIPQDIAKACKVVATNKVKKIDYATVNDEVFLNNSSVGVYAKYVHQREKHQKVLGKILAYMTGLISTIAKFGILHTTLQYDNNTQTLKTPIIFVSNNDYSFNKKLSVRRKTLTGGELSVNILIHGGVHTVFNSLKHLFIRNKSVIRYKSFHTKKLIIDTTNTKIITAKDGEIITAKLPLTYEIHSKLLNVIIP